jgi:hypothetical protein
LGGYPARSAQVVSLKPQPHARRASSISISYLVINEVKFEYSRVSIWARVVTPSESKKTIRFSVRHLCSQKGQQTGTRQPVRFMFGPGSRFQDCNLKITIRQSRFQYHRSIVANPASLFRDNCCCASVLWSNDVILSMTWPVRSLRARRHVRTLTAAKTNTGMFVLSH